MTVVKMMFCCAGSRSKHKQHSATARSKHGDDNDEVLQQFNTTSREITLQRNNQNNVAMQDYCTS